MIVTKYLMRLKLQQSKFNLMGIDLGTAFTGFSVTYNLKQVLVYDLHYSPCYSPHDSTLYKKIIEIINKEKIGGILIGKPSFQKGYIDEFTNGLESNLIVAGLKTYITQVGEDYTTSQARKISKTNNKFLHDGMAAMLILQNFLNDL
ncbi:unnamed protein product [Paramecium sonneborni]|uniref:Pre-16S rRNA nuclease n=1 Tax=Paramecium sonneborni TaxID=65129 RepID=A0A8S1MH26_9CILI|nr:unnamed protein product [Paramecium sonneborni]